MNIKVVRFVFVLVLVISVVGLSTSNALADRPEKLHLTLYPEPYTFEGVCEFPVTVTPVLDFDVIDFFDGNGKLIREADHFKEMDTFTANGKTLVSLPYQVNISVWFDSEMNLIKWTGSGVVVKIILPDGSLFVSAGRTDWLSHQDVPYILAPDRGTPVDLDRFCAELLP